MLPALKIAGNKTERKTTIKILGVWLDENISWEERIPSVQTKLAKDIGLLYRAKLSREGKSLKSIYFAYIRSYLNYANIARASTHRIKLKTICFHHTFSFSVAIPRRLKRLPNKPQPTSSLYV